MILIEFDSKVFLIFPFVNFFFLLFALGLQRLELAHLQKSNEESEIAQRVAEIVRILF
jgi:hypothetical protein